MLQNDKSTTLTASYALDVSMIFIGVVLLFGCSQLTIPIHPVPITLQTVGVIFILLTYDSQKALHTMLAYVFLGALGAPLFAGYRGGISVILGPTGGYILGFVLAALVAIPLKKLFDAYSSILKAFVLSIIITFVIMAAGVCWLSLQLGFLNAIEVGFLPFLLPGLIKSGILSLILRGIGYFRGGK